MIDRPLTTCGFTVQAHPGASWFCRHMKQFYMHLISIFLCQIKRSIAIRTLKCNEQKKEEERNHNTSKTMFIFSGEKVELLKRCVFSFWNSEWPLMWLKGCRYIVIRSCSFFFNPVKYMSWIHLNSWKRFLLPKFKDSILLHNKSSEYILKMMLLFSGKVGMHLYEEFCL